MKSYIIVALYRKKVDIVFLVASICLVIGCFLLFSVLRTIIKEYKESKKKRNVLWGVAVIILDIASDPITSEGMRLLFGAVFTVMGLIFFNL